MTEECPHFSSEEIFLRALFVDLDNRRITYSVLRNYQMLPFSTGGSDIDIWIHPAHKDEFIQLLSELSILYHARVVSVVSDDLCPRIIIQSSSWGVQFDIHIGLAQHKGVAYIDNTIIEENTVLYNGVCVLSKGIDKLIAFFKETLNNKSCRVSLCEAAADFISGKSDSEICAYLSSFSEKNRERIIEVLRARTFDDSTICQLGKECSRDIQTVSSKIAYLCNQVKKTRRLFKQPGYTIAFMGTDGAGKSFIINSVMPVLSMGFHNGVRYEHMRPNFLPSLACLCGREKSASSTEPCTAPHASRPSGFWGSLLRLGYYLIDYTLGYYRKVFWDKALYTHVWIFDRYFYDYLIDPRRARLSLPRWIVRVAGILVPKPDLIVCLGGEPDIIYARKPETSLEEVKRQTKELKAFCSSCKNAIWVETTIPKEQSISQVMQAILSMMSSRFSL